MITWAASLARDAAVHLHEIRLIRGAELCERADEVWLRGAELSQEENDLLRQIPGLRRFDVLADQRLQPQDSLLPRGALPDGPWQPLTLALPVARPVAALSGQLTQRIDIRMVRSDRERPANLLMTTASAWCQFASAASAVRLSTLRMVAAADGRVLIHGTPLPHHPGQLWSEQDHLATPCGWTWEPAVDARLLHKRFTHEPDEMILLYPDGRAEAIAAARWIPSTRAAARATAELGNA